MHYLFVELAEFGIQVSFNLFCEKHGKNSRDQHFSTISNFINQESMVKKLACSQDICDAIEKHQHIANLNNERVNSKQKKKGNELKIVNTKAFVIPTRSSTRNSCSILTVVGLKKYYNFFNNGSLVLKTHFMSDQTNYITLKTKKGSKLSETNITTPDIIMRRSFLYSVKNEKLENNATQ